eukprot:TRINITY_DN4667_c0_g1_i1.p1 TRINITY_DN4667_c0_g1~~TRINITY_DN4667_c0_g1_i1.p1  ORF type:complete len:773 (-),score=169.82 TRINITY_DN4667_c0_g1_i1:362-2680(-)
MGACLEKGFVCLVSELMLQGTLTDVLRDEEKELPLSLRIHFMHDIVKGMNYLHSSNPPILHRDLKSPNILVDDRFKLKVSDFGLSTLQGTPDADTAVGSLLWLAPEIILGKPYERPADVYSFGIIAWEIMTRVEPYSDLEDMSSLPLLVAKSCVRPSMDYEIPEHIQEDVIKMSWEEKPQLRPTFSDLNKLLSAMTEASTSASMGFLSESMEQGEKPPQGPCYIVCTRVHDAETLWDEIPLAMGDATIVLVESIRKICKANRGYISQNDGDSFVIAFQRAAEAISFCVDSQDSLQQAEWPRPILDHESSKAVFDGTMKGLRIQMGIGYGDCDRKLLPNSKRLRFVGKEVSMAMKLSRAAQGGQVLLSDIGFQSIGVESDVIDRLATVRALEKRSSTNDNRPVIYEVIGFRLQSRADKMAEAARFMPSITISRDVSAVTSTNLNVPDVGSSKISPLDPKKQARDPINFAMDLMSDFEGLSWNDDADSLRPKSSWEIDPKDLQEGGSSLGTGSFGTVVVGTYKGQKVAIKRMLTTKGNFRASISFTVEVAVVRKLSHPNIVKFIGADTSPYNMAIVLELVEPGCLRDYLRDKSKPMNHEQKWRVIHGVVEAMAYLHSMNPPILHRDLKSANVLINDMFDAKVCDFGFARIKSSTRTMTKCGTLSYQAPEILSGKRYNEKADVYSFGILVWEIETRELPYAGIDPVTLPLSVVDGMRPSTSDLIDTECISHMKRCWANDPNERPSFQQLRPKHTDDDVEAIMIPLTRATPSHEVA